MCENCLYHGPGVSYGEGLCENPDSTFHNVYTADDAYCKAWELRECCDTCRHCYNLEKADYSKGGCVHTDIDGWCCMAFADEGLAVWMTGQDRDKAQCEDYTPKEGLQ